MVVVLAAIIYWLLLVVDVSGRCLWYCFILVRTKMLIGFVERIGLSVATYSYNNCCLFVLLNLALFRLTVIRSVSLIIVLN